MQLLGYRDGKGDEECMAECTGYGGDHGPGMDPGVSAATACSYLRNSDPGKMADFLSCADDKLNRCVNACGFGFQKYSGDNCMAPKSCGTQRYVNRPGVLYPSRDAIVAAAHRGHGDRCQ
jgi:hypothetical protein